MRNKLKEIEKNIKDFLKQLGWEVDVNLEISEKIVYARIQADEPSLLIGKGGETLNALQHLLRLIINKKIGEFVNLVVDINDYKDKQRILLENDCLKKAKYVKKTGKEIALRPMNSFERRIVHLALKNVSGVVSVSEGEGKNRRVVIRPE